MLETKQTIQTKQYKQKIEYINSTLLLSQAKSWIENENSKKLIEVFSCKNSSRNSFM